VLLAATGTWLNQALESMLEPLGYRVLSVRRPRALDRAPTARPDVILMDANLQDLTASRCAAPSVSIGRLLAYSHFMITSTPADQAATARRTRAGAWDYLSLVINSDELALKLDAFRACQARDRSRPGGGCGGPASGLYTMRGLERRARELVSDAFRVTRRSPAWRSRSSWSAGRRSAPVAAPPVAVVYAGQILQARGRTSDAIGASAGTSRSAPPSTAPPPDGAVRMARRLTQALENAAQDHGLPPCWFGPATRRSQTCTRRRSLRPPAGATPAPH